MERALIVYNTRTGNTAKVAQRVAEKLGADVEAIHETRNRRGLFEYLRSAHEALKKREPPIAPLSKDAGNYDLVILGCPVWAGNMASPMRTYILSNGGKFKRLALFCTQGGHGAKSVLRDMRSLCSQPAVAEMIVNEADIKSGRWEQLVDRFADDI